MDREDAARRLLRRSGYEKGRSGSLILQALPPRFRQVLVLGLAGCAPGVIADKVAVEERAIRRLMRGVAEIKQATVMSSTKSRPPVDTCSLDDRSAEDIGSIIKRRITEGEKSVSSPTYGLEDSILQKYRTLVLDLAYQEYIHRVEGGEPLDAEGFSKQFPGLENSLRIFIELRRLLSLDPELKDLEASVAWPDVGDHFLQFKLESQIGQGTFGRVFRASEPAVGDRQVVLKIAPQVGVEARALGRLIHPNIVPIYSHQEDESTGLSAFSMPYLGRATLEDVLNQLQPQVPGGRAKRLLDAIAKVNVGAEPFEKSKPSPILKSGSYVDGVISIIADLADALAHAHKRGIYHRDLKPSNVLVTQDGRPLLLDFSLSVDADLPVLKIGGTLPYMAPEELERLRDLDGDSLSGHYDPRSDIYSLAVIAYQLFTGHLPFGQPLRGRSLNEVADDWYAKQKKDFPKLQSLNRDIDRPLARIIEKCLSFNPDERPESAEQFACELQRQLTPLRRTKRWLRNHPAGVSTVGAALLACLFVCGTYFAVQPTYGERQLVEGQRHLQEARYQEAVNCFNGAAVAGISSHDLYLARGQAQARLGHFSSALSDFQAAADISPTALSLACAGYSLSCLNANSLAIGWYLRALDAGYPKPAVLLNNTGMAYYKQSRYADAERNFLTAIQFDSTLPELHANLAMSTVQGLLQKQSVPPTECLSRARAVAEHGPGTGKAFAMAAVLCAEAAKHNPNLIRESQDYVSRAVRLGWSPGFFTALPQFSRMGQNQDFKAALATECITPAREHSEILPPF